MTESSDYRKYLEQRFADLTLLVNAQFTNVNEQLKEIHGEIRETKNRIDNVENDITNLQVNDELHVKDCPAMIMIEKLQSEVRELKIEALTLWIKKHWKLSILIAVITLYFAYSLFTLLSIEEIVKLIK